jgi:hypothetical protein
VRTPDAGIPLSAELGGQGDPLSSDGLGDELDLDLFLLGHKDDRIALDDGLATQRPTLFQFGGREADTAAVAGCAMLDAHAAPAAAALSSAGEVEGYPGRYCRIGEQRADLDLDHLA